MASPNLASELVAILRTQEMRGERIVNHIRAAFAGLSALMLAGAWSINTPAASLIFAVQVAVWLAFAGGLYLFFQRRPTAYVWWIKYVAITVDLGLLTLSAFGAARNHTGIIEYFQSFIPLVYVLWNLMSGFRYSVAACFYSAGLTLLFNSLVLAWAVGTAAIPISPISVYGEKAINIADQVMQIVFIAVAGVVAGIIARISRNLVLRAEAESLKRAQLEKEKEQLGKYLSKELVDYVLAEPGRLELGGTRKQVTVMFTDIRNFTPLAESIEPERVVSLLNEYFTDMVDIVFRYGGTLDKYIGDGLMAVFGAPFPVEKGELRAVLVALEMVQALERLNRRIVAQGYASLDIGVGIASGPAISGNIGSTQRMEYTCIGDTVNFAARLEQLNKELGSHIIVSPSTYAALAERVPARQAPPLRIKGKAQEVGPWLIELEQVGEARIAELRAEVLGDEVAKAA